MAEPFVLFSSQTGLLVGLGLLLSFVVYTFFAAIDPRNDKRECGLVREHREHDKQLRQLHEQQFKQRQLLQRQQFKQQLRQRIKQQLR